MTQLGLSKYYNMSLTKNEEHRKIMIDTLKSHNVNNVSNANIIDNPSNKGQYHEKMRKNIQTGGSLTSYYNGGLSADYAMPAMIQTGGSITGHYNGGMSSNKYQGGQGFMDTLSNLNNMTKDKKLITHFDTFMGNIGAKDKLNQLTKGVYNKATDLGKQKGYGKRRKHH